MGIFAFLTALFKHLTGVGKVVEKSLPSEEEREKIFEIKQPRMEAGEMKRILREAKHYMFLNKKESIDNHVELVYGNLGAEDKAELKAALHQAFPKHK